MARRRPSYRERKARQRRSRTTVLLALIAVLFVIVVGGRFVAGKLQTRIEVAQYGRLEYSLSLEGIVMRNEMLVISPIPGSVRTLCREGEIVKAETSIVEVTNPSMEAQLQPVKEAIVAEIKVNTAERHLAIDAATQRLKSIRLQIETFPTTGNQGALSKLREEEQRLEEELQFAQQFYDEKLLSLSQRLSELDRLGRVGRYVHVTPKAGLVSYVFDGYEYFLSPSNTYSLKPDDFRDVTNRVSRVTDKQDVFIGQPVARVVDRFQMYVAFLISVEYSPLLSEGSRVSARFTSSSENVYLATVVHTCISEEGDWMVVVCDLGNYIDELGDARVIPAELIFEGYSGVILPETAIVTYRGQKHIYVVADGSHVPVPVKVKGAIDGYVAVEGVREGARVLTNP